SLPDLFGPVCQTLSEAVTVKEFRKTRRKVAMVVGAIALLAVSLEMWSATAPLRGRMAAHFDVRRKHYRVLVYGLPPAWRSGYADLLRERYGIEVRAVAYCIVSETLISYVESYDAVSVAAANRKFGRDVF